MQTLLKDRAWRAKNSGWLLFAFIPLMNYIAFFYIGYKAKQKNWTRLGILYTVITVLFLVINAYSYSSGYGSSISSNFENYDFPIGTLDLFFPLFYLIGVINAFVLRSSYLKRLAILTEREPAPHPLLSDRFWRGKNSRWMIWSFIPWIGGLSFLHIGYRSATKRWKLYGWIYLITGVLCILILTMEEDTYWGGYSGLCVGRFFPFIFFFTSIILYISIIINSIVIKKKYLNLIAPGWDQKHRQFSCLDDKNWRFRNSFWLIWSLIPFCGGTCFIHAGIRSKMRRWLIKGVIAVTANIAYVLIMNFLVEYLRTEGLYYTYTTLRVFYYFMILFIPSIISFAVCTIIRETYLEKVAERYRGDADAELLADLNSASDQERFAKAVGKRSEETGYTDEKTVPEITAAQYQEQHATGVLPDRQKTKKPEKVKPSKADEKTVTAPQQEPGKRSIDINTCSESELLSLPGISLADARRALAYREKNGGFASVDAFVAELNIKPHFAAQIFETVTASAPTEAPRVNKESRPHRTLDI